MKIAHSRAETEARLTDALVRLGSARREKLSKEDFDVYADGLREFPTDVVRLACDELGRTAPEEFQPRFPPLHVIRERCLKAVEANRAKQQLLRAPSREELYPLLPQEKIDEFKRKIQDAIGRKAMP